MHYALTLIYSLTDISSSRKLSHKNDEAENIMIKTQILLWSRIHWLELRIVRKQPNFDNFGVKYLQIANFSEK